MSASTVRWVDRRRSARIRSIGVRAAVMLAALAGAVLGGGLPARADAVRVTNDVVYGDASGVQLTMDVYQPSGSGPFPALVLIHGGVFTHGDKSNLQPDATFLAENGYVGFSINYRLAPQYPFPAGLEDAQTAVEYVRAHAADYQVNPDRIGSLGASAGGTYTDLLATDGSGSLTTGARILAGVAWSGPTDLTTFGHVIRQLVGPNATPAQIAATDPVTYVDPTDAPMMFVNGTGEEIPVEQAQRIDAAYRQAGIQDELLISPLPKHAEFLGRTVYPQTLAFLNKYLRDAKISKGPSPSASASPTPTASPSTTQRPVTSSPRSKGSGSSAPLMIGIVAAIVLLGSAAALGPTLLRRGRSSVR